MTDLTPNHPAVQVGCQAASEWVDDASADEPDHIALALHMTAACITAALPHLTADDLRDTDAAEEIRTEGWLQGWAAGRDLDGDEDATPHLRDTPAGRALMAEAWDALIESMSASGEFHDVDLRTMQRLNPYRKDDA